MPTYDPKARSRFSTSGFYPELWAACLHHQDNRCAICRCALTFDAGKLTSAHADHDHADKLPRGILCAACNVSLGTYEKHQRLHGLILGPYEHYLAAWPTRAFVKPARAQRAYRRKTLRIENT